VKIKQTRGKPSISVKPSKLSAEDRAGLERANEAENRRRAKFVTNNR
jgi:hypothetical protein